MNTASASAWPSLRLSWTAPTGLLGLSFVNTLLRVLTLGIYTFWAKTEVRRRLWSAVRLDGEPLAYTGTGKQLFLGFLIVLGVVFLPMILLITIASIIAGDGPAANVAVQIGVYVVILMLWGLGSWRAQRYRLANTLWRGIRGSLVGDEKAYAATFFFTGLLVPLTLGWIMPWRSTKLQGMLVNATRFGNTPFTFTASAGPLYPQFALAWFVFAGVVSVGIFAIFAVFMQYDTAFDFAAEQEHRRWFFIAYLTSLAFAYLTYLVVSAWYRAQQANHFAANTRIHDATLRGTQTGSGLIVASVKSVLIMALSLGILAPIAQAILWRYMIKHLQIDGPVDLDQISRGAVDAMSRGEGLAQAFDFDV